ncbi:winged helix-turn-helix domain-containing protein [Pseudarthrobacter sp. J1738]|uniref:winged helix-turn-helix domain-containing protein n=1 Tax=unclassified Pseudarthrobacter TaxID=2647000 RepID=UPI003D2B5A6C
MLAQLSLAQARRIALGAQGLAKARKPGPVSARAISGAFERMQLVQIDSVNVLSRSHYLPFFSRLGDYDRSTLETMSNRSPRRMMEYWAHEASYIQPQHFHDLRVWQNRTWMGAKNLDPELRDQLAGQIMTVLSTSRPLTASEVTARIDHKEEREDVNWGWNWNSAKRVLEDLFEQGTITSAGRTDQFERRYTLTHKAYPQTAQLGEASREESMVRLIKASARAHGIGSLRCLADYFRMPQSAASTAVDHLLRTGVLEKVQVAGWDRELYLHTEAALPRRATGRALLSPFDPVVFERRRLEELFGMHYRLEIYTPAHKRRYGYYVLPFLLRDSFVARVDLKADRQASALWVRASHAEPGAPLDTAQELAAELRLMATWLKLDTVRVDDEGDLGAQLADAVHTLEN